MVALFTSFGKCFHRRSHGFVKTIHVRALVTGGRSRYKMRQIFEFSILSIIMHVEFYIVANGFRKAGGTHGHHFGLILTYYIVECGVAVGATTKNGCFFSKIGRCNIHRFFVMTN